MALSHLFSTTASPAPLESRGLHAVHQHPSITLPEETLLLPWPTETQPENFRAASAEPQFGCPNHKLVIYCVADTPSLTRSWGADLEVLWRFTLSTADRTRSWSSMPCLWRAGSQCLSGGWGQSTAQEAAQAQGTRSCHSLFRVADHDLRVSGVLQDPFCLFPKNMALIYQLRSWSDELLKCKEEK